jgi:TRAP-type C4-dicarboxylate transport system permease small subunit
MPGFLARYRGVLRTIGYAELVLASASFAGVVVLNCVQIGLRMLTPWSVWWVQEVSQLASLLAYFFGISMIYKLRQDVVILFVYRRLPESARFYLFFMIQALIVLFVFLVAQQALDIAPMELRNRTYILNIPKFYSTLPLLIASLSMLATAIYHLISVGWAAQKTGSRDLDRLEAMIDLFPGFYRR